MGYNQAVWDRIVSVGQSILQHSSLTSNANPLCYNDVEKVRTFIREAARHSQTWNEDIHTHTMLSEKIAEQICRHMNLSNPDIRYAQCHALLHDIGRMFTHELLLHDQLGIKLLPALGFCPRYHDMLLPWHYWISEDFSPLLRDLFDRIQLVADQCGKLDLSGKRLRSLEEIEDDVRRMPESYKGKHAYELKEDTIKLAADNSMWAFFYALEDLSGRGMRLSKIQQSIP